MWNFKSLQKPLVFLFLLCLFPLGAMAQSIIKGTVNDENGEPVIGATVKVKETQKGTITDFDGNYSIEAASNATLVFSYVGYVTQEVKVGGKSTLNITMKEDNTTLNDVVVIGYGTMKKKLVTGATVQVKGERLVYRLHSHLHSLVKDIRFISAVSVQPVTLHLFM